MDKWKSTLLQVCNNQTNGSTRLCVLFSSSASPCPQRCREKRNSGRPASGRRHCGNQRRRPNSSGHSDNYQPGLQGKKPKKEIQQNHLEQSALPHGQKGTANSSFLMSRLDCQLRFQMVNDSLSSREKMFSKRYSLCAEMPLL